MLNFMLYGSQLNFLKREKFNHMYGDFPGGTKAKTLLPMQEGGPVFNLVRELYATCCNQDPAQPNK